MLKLISDKPKAIPINGTRKWMDSIDHIHCTVDLPNTFGMVFFFCFLFSYSLFTYYSAITKRSRFQKSKNPSVHHHDFVVRYTLSSVTGSGHVKYKRNALHVKYMRTHHVGHVFNMTTPRHTIESDKAYVWLKTQALMINIPKWRWILILTMWNLPYSVYIFMHGWIQQRQWGSMQWGNLVPGHANVCFLVYTQTTTGAILAPEGGLTDLRLIQHSQGPNLWYSRKGYNNSNICL